MLRQKLLESKFLSVHINVTQWALTDYRHNLHSAHLVKISPMREKNQLLMQYHARSITPTSDSQVNR